MEVLRTRLEIAVGSKDYPTCQHLCEEMELLAEEASFVQQEEVESLLLPDFYSLYLLVLLLQGNLNEAKYLWKRSPNSQRGVYDMTPEEEMSAARCDVSASTSSLAKVWALGKALWQDDLASALATLSQSNSWSQQHESIQMLSTELSHVLLHAYLELVHKAYRDLRKSQVAAMLKMSEETLTNSLPHVQWSVTSDGQYLQPNYEIKTKKDEEKMLDGVLESVELMKRVATYVSYFEKSNLKVDLSNSAAAPAKKA